MAQQEDKKTNSEDSKGMAEIYALGAFSAASAFVGEWVGAFVGSGIGHSSFDQDVGGAALPIGSLFTIVFLIAYRDRDVGKIRQIGKIALTAFLIFLVVNLILKGLNMWGFFNSPTLAAFWREIFWAVLFGALLVSAVLAAISWALIGWRSRERRP